jgi:hypothetical protein
MEIKLYSVLVGYLKSEGQLYWAGKHKGGWVSNVEKAIRYKTDKAAQRARVNPELYGRDTEDDQGRWIFQAVEIEEVWA